MFPFGNFTGTTTLDADGFAPPNYGGAVGVAFNTLAYTDIAAKKLFTLPQGAIPVLFVSVVTTAFNAGTTNPINIGNLTTPTQYATGIAGQTAAINLTAGWDKTKLGVQITSGDETFTGIYVPTGTASSAGAATIFVFYILK